MAQTHLDFAQQLSTHRASFPGPHLQMVLDSMLAGNTAGELWNVAQNGEPPLLILWDKGNDVFYLAGDGPERSSLSALAQFLSVRLLPQARAHGVRRCKARALSPSLAENLPRLFSGIEFHPSRTHFSVHDAACQVTVPAPDLSDLMLLPISPSLLSSDELADADYVREEIRGMWPSEDRFNERGFGTLAVVDSAVVCWCTAEYVGPTHCGIGIATAPRYQCRGIATATAARFVREAGARGLIPCWECDAANTASVRVAEKVGFVRQAEETYWIGWFDQAEGEERLAR
jgi:RimJ/RimL family protein N-acetyltransferase